MLNGKIDVETSKILFECKSLEILPWEKTEKRNYLEGKHWKKNRGIGTCF